MSGSQAESEFSSLANTSWTSRDGASKLSITKDALIERTADSASVIYYTVSDEKADATGLSVTLSASEDIAIPGADTVVRIENEGASTTLTCDLLKATYVQDGKAQTALSMAGDIQDLCTLTGKNEADFESILETFGEGAFALRNVGLVGRRGLDRLRRAQHLDHVHAR